MRLVSIYAKAVDCGFQTQKLQTSRVASPMSQFPKFAEKRASWMWPSKKVFVRVEAEDGTVGWSCTNGGEVVELIINSHIAPLIEGADTADAEQIWDQMFLSLLPNDRSGFSMMAVAGVDIALWDVRAKAASESLVDFLGGGKDTLPVYATTSQPETQAYLGWHGLKAAAPYGPESGRAGFEDNVEYIRRFSAAAGAGVPVMIDAFMAWDADYTLAFLDAVQDLPLKWVEDPLPPYDMEGLRKLKSEMKPDVALALGNFSYNRWECSALLDEKLVDILQPDVAWAGGITEALRILDLAKQAEVPVILHNSCEQPWALALAAAHQTDATVEFVDRGESSPLYTLMGNKAQITDGRVSVPNSITGNQPPQNVQALFTSHVAPRIA